ncbi:MAG: acyltransferase [Deltaproteobacteria bacterium]|nr:acyltransferase [Deltaproteobacteria bacterium]
MSFFRLDSDDLVSIQREILQRETARTMNDRDCAAFFGLPEGCRMRENAKILAPQNLKLGKYVWIGEGAVLDAQGGLEIGDESQIGLGVMLWSHTSHKQARLGATGKSKQGIQYKPTRVGSRVFIAGPSVVLAGVSIGDGAIVRPLSLVDRDLAPGEVFGGHVEPAAFQSLVDRVAHIATLEERLAELEARVSALCRSVG